MLVLSYRDFFYRNFRTFKLIVFEIISLLSNYIQDLLSGTFKGESFLVIAVHLALLAFQTAH